jgi:2-methylisocitrate lyase-like PEP mutase family enzyme
MRKTSKNLREIIASDNGLARIMAVHNPLSAMLVEEAGFDGIWASGFELSAACGLPDVSLVSMAEHLSTMRAMAQRTTLPIVADVVTGYGNAINILHTIEQYEDAGAATVVIEDKTFPKVTSLVAGGRQELLRVEEFQGKLEAAVHARGDPDFMISARDEALIAGLGEQVALERAASYAEAGADMILIHSKHKDAGRNRELHQCLEWVGSDRDCADGLSANDRSSRTRAAKGQDVDLWQPRHPRIGDRYAKSICANHRRRRHPPGRQRHRAGFGDFQIAKDG